MKEPEKLTLVVNSIPSKCLKFALRCLESSLSQWSKCTYRELRSVLGWLQKISCCANGDHKQHLFLEHSFSFDVCKSVSDINSKEQPLLVDQDRGMP